jgi:hypothetical protein
MLTYQEKRFAKVLKGSFAHFCKEIIPLFAIILVTLASPNFFDLKVQSAKASP